MERNELANRIYGIRNKVRDSEGLWDVLDDAIDDLEELAKEILK